MLRLEETTAVQTSYRVSVSFSGSPKKALAVRID
jgi:hypothetical protein